MAQLTIGVVDGQPWVGSALQQLLGSEVEIIAGPASSPALPKVGLFLLGSNTADVPGAIAAVRRLRELRPLVPVFLMAWVSSEQLAIAALKEGVADYFAPPVELKDVTAAVRRFMLRATTVQVVENQERPIIGDSTAMQALRAYMMRVAQRDSNALLLGETGTGKDLVAEAIHANSPRRNKPFACVNCAAIPDTLLESELFGYERGAFTGANATSEGKIRQAHGGTVFFDEIGEMTPYAQAKILRVIEGKEIQRLGGKASVPVNVRIIAATNQDLAKLVTEQRFRRDLYFRLNVTQIQLPALRDRREDIVALLEHYVRVFNTRTGAEVEGFTQEALDYLTRYDWPGNVRELKNMVEGIFIDPPHPRIDLPDLPGTSGFPAIPCNASERDQLLEVLEATQWNKSKAAAKLHWSRMKIYRKLAKYNIEDREECALSAGAR
ncbi:MAG TPA: sigma-54 dependent transcriptional regulator [Bryobacteraceae bacterium]